MAEDAYRKLRALRNFERKHLQFLVTLEDFDVVREIGFHHAAGKPLTLKLLCLLGIGSEATIQRRLARLKRLGVVRQTRSARDKRRVELAVSPEVQRIYRQYGQLISRQAD
jgi:hypothetical protein